MRFFGMGGVWLAIVLTACLPVSLAAARPESSGAWMCNVGNREMHLLETCFRPQVFARVESHLRVRPLDPRAIVRRDVDLHLTQVVQYGRTPGIGIAYVFGHIPSSPRGFAQWTAASPIYILVTESFPRDSSLRTPYVHFNAAASIEPGSGNWLFGANFRQRNMSVRVETNLTRADLLQIGRALMRTG